MGPLMVDLKGEALAEDEPAMLRHPAVGGVLLFARNFRSPGQVRRLVADIRSAAGRPILVAVDQEGGRVQRMRSGFSALPPARALGDIYDRDPGRGRELAGSRGRLLALELEAVDIDFSFRPGRGRRPRHKRRNRRPRPARSSRGGVGTGDCMD